MAPGIRYNSIHAPSTKSTWVNWRPYQFELVTKDNNITKPMKSLYEKCKECLTLGYMPIVKNGPSYYMAITGIDSVGRLVIGDTEKSMRDAVKRRFDNITKENKETVDSREEFNDWSFYDCVFSPVGATDLPIGLIVRHGEDNAVYNITSKLSRDYYHLESVTQPGVMKMSSSYAFVPEFENVSRSEVEEALKTLRMAGVLKDGQVVIQ